VSGDTGKRKGGVVRYGVKGFTKPLLDDVIAPMRAAGLGKHVKNLYNDYVYFWRWAAWQATELPPGPGIVAFITAASYLDGVSMGGLRSLLRRDFDELWIVDLGGEGRGALVEENVFEIRTPVAIAFAVCTGSKSRASGGDCAVRYVRVGGSREAKFDVLRGLRLTEEIMTVVPGSGLDVLTPRTQNDYSSWPEISDLFPWIHSGAQLKRTWPIGESRALLERRWSELTSMPVRLRAAAMRATDFRKVSGSYSPLLSDGPALKPITQLDDDDTPEKIERYGYRSFDRQWVIADARLADRPRPELWRARGPHQIYLTTLTSTKIGRGPALTVSPYVPDLHYFRGSYGAKDVMPVYRDRFGHEPNVPHGLLEAIGNAVGGPISIEDLVAYVHAILGTGAFSDMFADELAEGAGPVHVPITADAGLFSKAVSFGRDLLWWHTWGERFGSDGLESDLPESLARELTPVLGYPETFSYLAAEERLLVGTGSFGPISAKVWEFEVSGLKVLQSWLAYRMTIRKGRKSSPLDEVRPQLWTHSEELLKLVSILQHTVEVTPGAAALLREIVDGPLIESKNCPSPTVAERKVPRN
jgi:hypothetical protein